MISWEKKPAVALALALVLALPGCQKPASEEDAQKLPEVSAPREEAVVADPTHIYEEVKKDFLIDAEVFGSPTGVIPKVYEGHCHAFTKEEIDAFLEKIGDGIASVDTDERTGGEHFYAGTCNSGAIFHEQYSEEKDIISMVFSYHKEKAERYDRYPIYINQGDYDNNSGQRLAYLFEEPEDLSFQTSAEAEAEVREALAALGMEDLVLNRTLYLSHDRLIQAGEVLQGEDWGSSAGKGGVAYSLIDDWSEQDDCYMFEFFSGIDGIPLTYHSWKKEAISYCGNEITVWYNAEGIVSLQTAFPWMPDEVVEEPEQVLSAGEALETARGKLSNVVTGEETVLTKAMLQYFYIQDRDRWLLRPVWEFSIRRPSLWGDGYMFDYVLVDAVTGEEI